MIMPNRKMLKPMKPYIQFPTSDYKEIVSGVVDTSQATSLKRGDLLESVADNETYKKTTGSAPVGVLTNGENYNKKNEWESGTHIQITRRGRILIAKEDLPSTTAVGNLLTVKNGSWAIAAAATGDTPADLVRGRVMSAGELAFDCDINLM